MRVLVKLFAGLREISGRCELIEDVPSGSSVGDIVHKLCGELGHGFRKQVLDERGEPLGYIKILLNGHDIAFLQGMATKLQEGDEIAMFPPVGGGRPDRRRIHRPPPIRKIHRKIIASGTF